MKRSRDAVDDIEWLFMAVARRNKSRQAIASRRNETSSLLVEFCGDETDFNESDYDEADLVLELYGANQCSKGHLCDAPYKAHRSKSAASRAKVEAFDIWHVINDVQRAHDLAAEHAADLYAEFYFGETR